MFHIKINGLEPISKVEFGVIVQPAALKPFVPVCHPPTNQVPENVVVEVELKSNAVVETQILRIHRIAVDDALAERDGLAIATPDEEPRPLRHNLTKSQKIIFCQLFKV